MRVGQFLSGKRVSVSLRCEGVSSPLLRGGQFLSGKRVSVPLR